MLRTAAKVPSLRSPFTMQTQFWSPVPTYDGQFTAPDPLPSVHTQESDCQDNAPSLQADDPPGSSVCERLEADASGAGVIFRHSGWTSTRERVALALLDSDAPASRVLAFDRCGRRAYLLQSLHDPDVYKINSSKCKDRFCKPCARERAGRLARTLLDHTEKKELRFITLTLKTDTPNLQFELDRLYSAFQHLRRRAFWKRHVDGGAAMLEVKYNQPSERWHPHLHILVEGRYVPHTGLAAEWRHVTGDSFIVDIRAVKDNKRVTHYICKYATDPIDRSIGRSVDLLTQAIDAFQGRKSCLTFGTWRGVLLVDTDTKDAWRLVGTLDRLLWQARNGFEESIRVLASLWVYQELKEKNAPSPNGRSRPPPSKELLFP